VQPLSIAIIHLVTPAALHSFPSIPSQAPICLGIESVIFAKLNWRVDDAGPLPVLFSILTRTAIAFCALFVVFSIPSFSVMMGIMGSICSFTIAVTFPCACYLRLKWFEVSTSFPRESWHPWPGPSPPCLHPRPLIWRPSVTSVLLLSQISFFKRALNVLLIILGLFASISGAIAAAMGGRGNINP